MKKLFIEVEMVPGQRISVESDQLTDGHETVLDPDIEDLHRIVDEVEEDEERYRV